MADNGVMEDDAELSGDILELLRERLAEATLEREIAERKQINQRQVEETIDLIKID